MIIIKKKGPLYDPNETRLNVNCGPKRQKMTILIENLEISLYKICWSVNLKICKSRSELDWICGFEKDILPSCCGVHGDRVIVFFFTRIFFRRDIFQEISIIEENGNKRRGEWEYGITAVDIYRVHLGTVTEDVQCCERGLIERNVEEERRDFTHAIVYDPLEMDTRPSRCWE